MRHKFIVLVLVSLFSLDSAFKISLPGARLHIGHILVLILIGLTALAAPKRVNSFAEFSRNNVALMCFLMYSFLHFFLAINNETYFFVMIYVLLMYVVYYYFYSVKDYIDFNLSFVLMLYVLGLSGVIQLFLYFGFNYQVALGGLDARYYVEGGSISSRMRGFFLEPNWFGLFMMFCYMGYVLTAKRIKMAFWILTLMVFICILLSANRLIAYFFFLTVLVFFSARKFPRASVYMAVMFSLVPIILFVISLFYGNAGGLIEEDRSLLARTITAMRVIFFINESFTYQDWLIGKGLSNWSSLALENALTTRTNVLEESASARDTSDSYVMFFELGLIGIFILLADMMFMARSILKSNSSCAGVGVLALMVLLNSVFFYPVFFFVMYLVPYFMIRIYFLGPSKC